MPLTLSTSPKASESAAPTRVATPLLDTVILRYGSLIANSSRDAMVFHTPRSSEYCEVATKYAVIAPMDAPATRS